MLKTLYSKVKNNKEQILIFVSLLAIAGIAHGYNMFNYPYYENDEGTYMSQAWSLLTKGELAPYTYWYDHAPGGWVLIALWVKLTGGFFTFGMSINSGRTLMLVLHLLSTALLYFIAKKLSKNTYTAIIAVFVFSLSPLAIYFQRRVLLDNIMTFWVLLSLALLLKNKIKLVHVIASALAFGIAILTKENAIFFAPAFLYVIWTRAKKHHLSFALTTWLATTGVLVSLYFIYAALNGELLPDAITGDAKKHVSLLGTLKFQLERGSGLPFWDQNSDFLLNLGVWINRDFLTIVLGALCSFAAIVLSFRHKSTRAISIFVMLFFIFLMRGKTVIDFYIVPVIPFLGLTIGLAVPIIADYLEKYLRLPSKKTMTIFAITILFVLLAISRKVFYVNETAAQVAAVNWIKENLNEDDLIAIDCYSYVDLQEARFAGDKKFKNADWFWKIQFDSEIRDGKYNGNWRNLKYIALSHEMLKQTKQDGTQEILNQAFDNSYMIMDWTESRNSYLDLKGNVTTNGDWMAIYKVKDQDQILLDTTWAYYKDNFIYSYGQVIDQNGRTTSEGQSYALLRAVWADDQNTFDGVYQWTKDHLAHRIQDSLFSWLWERGALSDSATASDADEDIALALLFAYKKWGNQKYYSDALKIISDIWRQEVAEVNGRYILKLGAGISEDQSYRVNPSYFAPATYRIFAKVDPQHNWNALADDSYLWLRDTANLPDNISTLPPDWVNVNSRSGTLSPTSYGYGFDAFRAMCRSAQDFIWHGNQNAFTYLASNESFLNQEYEQHGRIFGIYNLDGSSQVDYESLSTTSGALCNFTITNPTLAEKVYQEKYLNTLTSEKFWGDKSNYYDQNWAWFATALHTGNMPNLWE